MQVSHEAGRSSGVPNAAHGMMVRPTLGRIRFAAVVVASALTLGLGACTDPTFIGVQDYGEIRGNVVDQKGAPLGSAIVSVGSLATIRSNADGSFVLPHVPVGEQVVNARLDPYGPGTVTVIVTKDKSVSADNIVLTKQTSNP